MWNGRTVQPHQVSRFVRVAVNFVVVEIFFVARAYDPSALAPADTWPPDAYEDRSHTRYCQLLQVRVAIHNVNRHTHLTAKHQKKRGFASCWVSARIIRQTQPPELAFPVERPFVSSSGQHIEECAVESLYQAF